MRARGHFYDGHGIFFQHSLFCEILIVAILGQLGNWLQFVELQDTHLGEVNFIGKTHEFFLLEVRGIHAFL